MRIVSCGILKGEVQFLAEKNNWDIELRFLDSSLHIDFDRLYRSLDGTLAQSDDPTLVVYGTCHPLMRSLLSDHGAHRTPSQNCVEMLLGSETFTRYLKQGAFFLLEDWARRWTEVSQMALGTGERGVAEIFQSEHQFLLCLTTPCSTDFSDAAKRVSETTGLPLRWMDVDLDNLERCLLEELEAFSG